MKWLRKDANKHSSCLPSSAVCVLGGRRRFGHPCAQKASSYGEAIEEDVGASEEDEVHYGFFTLPVVWPVDCSYSLDE